MVSLDYSNPNMNLFQEFQQYKRHPAIARVLEGGTCLQVGAGVWRGAMVEMVAVGSGRDLVAGCGFTFSSS